MGKSSQPVGGLWHYLNSRVEELRRVIPNAQRSWSREGIHRARVTTRRLKAAIDLLEPLLMNKPRRSFAKVLRKLRRGLGPLRDQDIMLNHLQELERRRMAPAAVQWLSARIRQERIRLQRKCARKMPPEKILTGLGRWWGLEQEIKEIEPAARSLARTLVPTQLKSFVECADRLAGANSAAEDVHRVRIAGKLLRYTLELANAIGFPLPKSVLKTFRRMQDALGLWHDYVVLDEQTLKAAIEDALPMHNPALHGEALSLARFCWRRSERYLNRFSQLWAKDGRRLTQETTQIFTPREDAPKSQTTSSTAVLSGVSI